MVARTKGESAFRVFNSILMLVIVLIILYPVCIVFSRSLMTDLERSLRPFALCPLQPDTSAYRFIFSSGSYILNAYGITISRTFLGTVLNVFFTACLSYVLSKKQYPLRNMLLTLVVITMWFQGGLIPGFFVIRALGLYNNFWVMILPGLISTWNMLILRNFFMDIPDSIEEAALIDGAHEITILFRIVLPLSTAAIATIGLFSWWATGIHGLMP